MSTWQITEPARILPLCIPALPVFILQKKSFLRPVFGWHLRAAGHFSIVEATRKTARSIRRVVLPCAKSARWQSFRRDRSAMVAKDFKRAIQDRPAAVQNMPVTYMDARAFAKGSLARALAESCHNREPIDRFRL